MPKSSRKKAKHIVARSILLEDAKGKPRIWLNAGEGDGHACICLFGENDRSIQISTTPEGGLYISLYGEQEKVSAVFSMSPDENGVLQIRDRKGCLGTLLGAIGENGAHKLMVFRDGQPHWSTPEPKKRKPKKK